MKSIKSIPQLKNKYVLVRADLNVPLEGGKVRDDFRISKVLPTLSFLQKKGAKIIVIINMTTDFCGTPYILQNRYIPYNTNYDTKAQILPAI